MRCYRFAPRMHSCQHESPTATIYALEQQFRTARQLSKMHSCPLWAFHKLLGGLPSCWDTAAEPPSCHVLLPGCPVVSMRAGAPPCERWSSNFEQHDNSPKCTVVHFGHLITLEQMAESLLNPSQYLKQLSEAETVQHNCPQPNIALVE